MSGIDFKDPKPSTLHILGPMWDLIAAVPPSGKPVPGEARLYPIRVLAHDDDVLTVESKEYFFSDIRFQVPAGNLEVKNWPFDPATKVERPAAPTLPRLFDAFVQSDGDSKVGFRFAPSPVGTKLATSAVALETNQAVVSPQPGPRENWPPLEVLSRTILSTPAAVWPNDRVNFPDTQLILGDIVCSIGKTTDAGKLLQNIGWDGNVVRLAPDGVRLRCKVSFPTGVDLEGLFLLHPAAEGETLGNRDTGLRLRLLVDDLEPSESETWSAAWRSIAPAPLEKSSLELIAQRAALPPAFVWSIVWTDDSKWQLDGEVGLPKNAMLAFVIGRRTETDEADGSARLLFDRMTIARGATRQVVLRGRSRKQDTKATLTLARADDGTESLILAPAASGGRIDLFHDARELTRTLKSVQGDRAELYGFVAADRGWLQLPLPNVPPLDTQFDHQIINNPVGGQPSAIDGFMRWSASVEPVLVTGVNPIELDLARRAPWSVTVEQAAAVSLEAKLQLDADPKKLATLKSWNVQVLNPEVSMRGLLWLSADAPGADEALPRLGAGPGTFFDVPFEINGSSTVDGTARFFLGELSLSPHQDALHSRKLFMRRIDKNDQREKSWAWLRHDRLPVAATMPMTRSGGESVRPLESRDLAPFIVSDTTIGQATVTETALLFREGSVLASTPALRVTRHEHWPWVKPDAGELHGVAFAAVGVPGVEVQPSAGGWSNLETAVRYDLPLLDEAFAMAKLPKDEDASKPPVPPDPPTTALDRDRIEDFWIERDRQQQLARVEDSYFLKFGHSGAVTNLVAPAAWTVSGTLTIPPDNEALPYGQLDINDGAEKSFTGDGALAGLDARFTRNGNVLTRGAGPIEVRGFSPSTYSQNDLALDNRDFGSGIESDVVVTSAATPNRVRKVSVQGKPAALLTRLKAIPVTVGGRQLELWIKELPLTANRFDAGDAVDPKAWTAGRAPLGGYEVRFFDPTAPGPDSIRIWSFDLVFLGLQSATFDNAFELQTAVLSCRLRLPASTDPLEQGGHELELQLKRVDNLVQIEAITAVQSPPFLLRSDDGEQVMRLSFVPSIAGHKILQLNSPKLAFTRFGAQWEFGLQPISIDTSDEDFTLDAALTAPGAISGDGFRGRLVPKTVSLTVGGKDENAKLTFVCELSIENANKVVLARLRSDEKSLQLFGFNVATKSDDDHDHRHERAGALVRMLGPDVTGSLFEGLPENAGRTATGLLAVTFATRDKASAAPLDVIAGNIDLDVSLPAAGSEQTGVRMRCVRIHLAANVRTREKKKPDPAWIGQAELYGTMRLDSAIRWPAKWQVDEPAKTHGPTNVKTLQAEADERFIAHRSSFQLEGHAVQLTDLREGADRKLNRLAGTWNTLARATHELEAKTVTIRWSSVEAFGLTTLGQLAAVQSSAVPGNNPPVEAAFVAGHRIIPGTAAENRKAFIPVSGIFKPGFGRRGDVLAGADSRPFRDALRKAIGSDTALAAQLVAIGGFAGVIASDDSAEARPLVRVPFLARLHATGAAAPTGVLAPGSLAQMSDAGITAVMPWHDTTLVPPLVISARQAQTPADARAVSLFALLRAGTGGAGAATNENETVEAAALAEQAFVAGAFGANPPLATTPFWIGAALRIAELMKPAAQNAGRRALSLIAGRLSTDGKLWRSTAAVVALDPTVIAREPSAPPRPRALITIGDELVITPFTSPVSGLPALVRIAFAQHAVPRVVVLADDPAYTIAPVPQPSISELPQPGFFAEGKIVYPRTQRGYARAPFENDATAAGFGWCAGFVQGGTSAVFDRSGVTRTIESKEVTFPASGIAGLQTSAALPRYAGALLKDAATSPLLWLGEKRAAPYLPLNLSLDAPPIAWLSVAPPRARLPLPSVAETALETAGVPPKDNPTRRAVLPDSVALASVSERAGILTARRLQLIAQVPDANAFDPSFSRFGVAAQTSSAPLRQIRTPRPGALPKNLPNPGPVLNRRPQASYLAPEKVARFVRGPAEAVSGDNKEATWTALLVAMPATGGIVSNRWDGSVRVRVEVTFEKKTGDAVQPLRWLFGTGSDDALLSRAWMRIGDTIVPFSRLQFKLPSTVQSPYVADVVIDILDEERQAGLLRAAALLNAVPPPPVELHLLMHPDSLGKLPAGNDVDWHPLVKEPARDLPQGTERTPVTLSWPLASVSTDRGGLPLRPVSIVFGDPAYDRELASEPLEDRKNVKIEDATKLPDDRGRLRTVFSVDRRAAEIDGRLAMMADLRFERPSKDGDGSLPDFEPVTADRPAFNLRAQVIPKIGEARDLWLSPTVQVAKLKLGLVHELSLAALRETDGAAVRWQPGDRLSLTAAAESVPFDVRIGTETFHVTTDPNAPLRVAMQVSAEPSFEPPTALYAVLRKTEDRGVTALSVPLFAQSPQATRIEAEKLASDIRRGLIHRRAVFVWRTAWPFGETEKPAIYVVKQDRNGQTHLPDNEKELEIIEALGKTS